MAGGSSAARDSAQIAPARRVLRWPSEARKEGRAVVNAMASELPSETGMLIERALRGVREAARLDDEPVLPALPSSRAVLDTAPPWPSVSASTRAPGLVAETNGPPAHTATARAEAREVRTSARWPLLLCAFVASVSGGAAFMSSPLGARPAVRRAVDATRFETAKVYHVVASFAQTL